MKRKKEKVYGSDTIPGDLFIRFCNIDPTNLREIKVFCEKYHMGPADYFEWGTKGKYAKESRDQELQEFFKKEQEIFKKLLDTHVAGKFFNEQELNIIDKYTDLYRPVLRRIRRKHGFIWEWAGKEVSSFSLLGVCYHQLGNAIISKSKINRCEICYKFLKPNKYNKGKQRFCSKKCANKFHAKKYRKKHLAEYRQKQKEIMQKKRTAGIT